MARRKNQPETVLVKCHLSERLREIRTELYGERGGSEMARQLGVPIRTWYNYESGVTVPAEILLKFMELTSVEPLWLLHGRGSKFRPSPLVEILPDSNQTVRSLLRTALQHLERRNEQRRMQAEESEVALKADASRKPAENSTNGVSTHPDLEHETSEDWVAAEREGRCVVVADDAMMPIVGPGAHVAFAAEVEPVESLDGSMVVAWIDGQPLVRWFRMSGEYGLLRTENADFTPSIVLMDLRRERTECTLRRVLWIGTPH